MSFTRISSGFRWHRPRWWAWLAAAIGLLGGVLLTGCYLYPNTIVVYTFDDYFDPAVIRTFMLETGTLVRIKTFKNNAEMISRLKVSWGEFDVVVPSSYTLDFLIKSQLLAPLDREDLPNFRNIAPAFTPPDHRREFTYAVPYFWMTFGIAYRVGEGVTPPQNWKDFFSPDAMAAYTGRISLVNEVQETMALAAIAAGFHPNTTEEKELEVIRARLLAYRELQPHLSSSSVIGLMDHTASVAMCWVPAGVKVSLVDPRVQLIVPTTDTLCVVDTLAIPVSSRKKAKAEKFINFLLRPDIAARLTNFSKFPTTVTKSIAEIDPVLAKSAAYVLPEPGAIYALHSITRSEFLYDAIWGAFTKGLTVDD
jgi:spermidine/putrescine transport system substrate-binding protein